MGHDKSGMKIGGKPMLQRAVDALRENFSPVFISVRSLPANVPEGTVALADLVPGCGPISGLHAALSATDSGAVFLCAVDLPFIRPDAARYLCSRIGDFDACVIRRENGYTEPLFAVYKKSCLTAATSMIENHEYRMSALLDACNVLYISELEINDPDTLLMNVNTPQEYLHASELAERK
ncbi:MAG: molybdenum cofactor guanylyltransferase [Clostridiales bacterium]|jgi:molybdopterin-guanine dinucleotide biosynthesis protein A|nr:molybdenum cofactor guanylyltransferase [Clostridiales bacterium]